MARHRLGTLAALCLAVGSTTTAHAQEVTIGSIHTGDWVGNPSIITGGFEQVADAHDVSVELNGVSATITPDPTDNTRGSWTVSTSLLSFPIQTPQHKLLALLYEGTDPDPDAVDRVTYFDTVDVYSFTKTPGDMLHANGAHIRLNEAGSFDLFEELVANGSTSWAPALEAEVLDPDEPEETIDPPISPCATLAALGLSLNDLGLDSTSFGLTAWPIGAPLPIGVSVCVDRLEFDVEDLDLDDIVNGIPDLDGDGVAEAFLELDSMPGSVQVDTVTGPMSAEGTVTAFLDVNIDVTLAFLGPLPAGVSITAVNDLQTSCSAHANLGHSEASIQLDLQPGLDPRFIEAKAVPGSADIVLGAVSVGGTGLCGVPGLIPDTLQGPLDAFMSGIATRAAQGDPSDPDSLGFVAEQLTQFLEDFELAGDIPLTFLDNSATLRPAAEIAFIDEDPDGITSTLETVVTVATASPNEALVRPEPDVYLQDNQAENFGPMTPWNGRPYMVAPALSAGAMTQFLHAAYSSGLLHSKLSEIDFDSLGICLDDGSGGCLTGPQTLTVGTLNEIFDGLDGIGLPDAIPLEVRSGFGLPPVVVVDDVPGTMSLKISAMHYAVGIYLAGVPDDAQPLLSFVGDLEGLLDLRVDQGGDLSVIPTVSLTLGPGKAGGTLLAVQPPISSYQGEINAALAALIPDVVALTPIPQIAAPLGFVPVEVDTRNNDETVYTNLVLIP